MRRLALLLLIPALALGAGACSDDKDDASSKSSNTTVAEDKADSSGDASGASFRDQVIKNFTESSGGIILKEDAECVASKLDGELSAAAKTELVKDEADPTKLEKDDQDAMVDAFDECIPIDKMTAALTSSLAADESTSDETKTCMTDAIKEKYDSSGELMRLLLLGTEDAQKDFTNLYLGCMPQTGEGSLAGQIASELESSGISPEAAECVSKSLASKYTAEELAGLQDGNVSSEIQSAIVELMSQCGVDPASLGN